MVKDSIDGEGKQYPEVKYENDHYKVILEFWGLKVLNSNEKLSWREFKCLVLKLCGGQDN